MGINYFTIEQIEILKMNPYVAKVSEKSITYTEKFRQDFYEQYNSNTCPTTILANMGFDNKILGKSRIRNITQRVKMQASRYDSFKDLRAENSGRASTKILSDEDKIKRLEHIVAYQKQQIEALKKIDTVNRKAQWKKQRQINS